MNDDLGAGASLAQSAASLIGVRFRLFGRDPATGVDCVGLIHASLALIGRIPNLPDGYKLRNANPERWLRHARLSGLHEVTDAVSPGDVIMYSPGPGQQHIVIAESGSVCIHAHAGLRRVVRQPMTFAHPALLHWRLT